MKSRISDSHWLKNVKIAHRGLHDSVVPENSLLAYQKAAELGLAIEIDVHFTKDGYVVIHHDDTLTRMTGYDKKIRDCTLEEIKSLHLLDTEEKVPLLTELLPIVKGRSPLLIEIKGTSFKIGDLEQAVYDILKEYDGDYAVQSFNPLTVKWFKDNAKEILRGQLSSWFDDSCGQPKYIYRAIAKLWTNILTKPDFVSYDQKFMPIKYCNRVKKKGMPIIAWTVLSAEREKELRPYYDNIIFENYIPESITVEK